MNRNKTIAALTLGCKVNLYDTEAMLELFTKNGYEIVEFDEKADIYLVNTCTVTNFGDKKSRQMLRRAKRQNPDSIVVAAGCYAQVFPEDILEIEEVNLIIGTKDRNNIVEIVENYDSESGTINYVSDIMEEKIFENMYIDSIMDRTRAYLKIQEGCNRYCTYCIIPYARGNIRSREEEDIIKEAKRLSENGYKEIVLTGIHVASYGKDLKNTDLVQILRKVHEIDGIKRIRFSSIEPTVIDNDFVEALKEMPKVCRHFHLSLQSGSDKTLKNMNRRYDTKDYREAVNLLRKNFPDVGITTDIIVGFPGETEEDFKESLNFVEEMKISKTHVFPYSPKVGTKAALFKDQIPNKIKSKRASIMGDMGKKLEKEFINKHMDKEVEVLFEEEFKDNYYSGYTDNYINVIINSKDNLENQIVNVKIVGIEDYLAISTKI